MTTSAVQFFYDNAGYSYDPKVETQWHGRIRCAKELAAAEELATEAGIDYVWDVDPDINSSEFSDETPAWELWECMALDTDRHLVAALAGIDFGRDGTPWNNDYKRIVEAELALEWLC